MAWHFDRTASTDKFTNDVDGPRLLTSNDRYVWMATPSDVPDVSTLVCFDMFEYINFKNESNELEDTVSTLHLPINERRKFNLITDRKSIHAIVALPDGNCWAGSTEYHDGSGFAQLFAYNTSSGSPVDLTYSDYVLKSNLSYGYGRLWATSAGATSEGSQLLCWYDVETGVWDETPIPAKHQSEPRSVCCDGNGFVLVTNANDLSISKFTSDGVFVSNIRLAQSGAGANRHPTHIIPSDNRTVLVSSFQGMISRVNTISETVTSYSTGLGEISSFTDGGQFLWVSSEKRPSSVVYSGQTYTCVTTHMSTGSFDVSSWAAGGDAAQGDWNPGSYYVDDTFDLIRINKTTQQIRHFGTEDRDIQIAQVGETTMSGVEVNSVISTPILNFAYPEGTRVIEPHIWSLNKKGELVMFPQDAMWRANTFALNGVAMVSYGIHDFIGE